MVKLEKLDVIIKQVAWGASSTCRSAFIKPFLVPDLIR